MNHSTVLLQAGGLNILTDPVWYARASPVQWAGPKRACAPGIRLEDLPPIHLLLLSHNHYDHLDLGTFRTIAKEHKPHIVVPLGLADYLQKRAVTVNDELEWWDRGVFAPAQVTCVPALHFSGRRPWDMDRTVWCGYVIETPAGAIYFAGDTAWGHHFAAIRSRLGRIRVACLPIGAYLPKWFMTPVHMGPEEAIRAHQILDPELSVAIHFNTFQLADDGYNEAANIFVAAAEREGVRPERIWLPTFGTGRELTKSRTTV